jgi:peptide/nickel transport system substrate-binding protein
MATVINYPISNTSWAAPVATDAGYEVASSTGADGQPLYTADMDDPAKFEAARVAAIDFLKAAGYTFDEATQTFTAAPEGAKMEYEVIVPGGGNGDHPNFMLLTDASNVLKGLGINLIVMDPADANYLWDKMDTGEAEMWNAAWAATPDPDMYQLYYSTNIPGAGGTDSNNYAIADPELDSLIMEARTSDDQTFRKATYKVAMDVILDWAVEVPIYQRKESALVSTERVNIPAFVPDMTPYWPWYSEANIIQMNQAQ